MKKVKYLVIGAGISGLMFAYQKNDVDVIVLEKESKAGGLCRSFYDHGFIFDVAGHFFHFHDKVTKDFFHQLIGNKPLCEVTKCAQVYYGGKYINAPFQYNIHQLQTSEFIECLIGLYYATTHGNEITFKDFVRKKYGTGIADKFLIPYNEKLYACDMNDLEKDSMGTFLPELNFDMLMNTYRGAHVRNYNDTFLYPINGCEEIINALLDRIDNKNVHLNEQVKRIDIEKKFVYTDSEVYHYEYLVNTAPIMSFARSAGIDENIDQLKYNQVLVLNLGFDKESVDKNVHWVYFPGEEIFYRVGFYNNIVGTDRLSIYVEISYKSDQKIDINVALQQTIVDLHKTGILDKHNLIAVNSIVINPAYAHITSLGKAIVDNATGIFEQKNVFSIGRYARWEYSAMDDSIEQAIKLAKEI